MFFEKSFSCVLNCSKSIHIKQKKTGTKASQEKQSERATHTIPGVERKRDHVKVQSLVRFLELKIAKANVWSKSVGVYCPLMLRPIHLSDKSLNDSILPWVAFETQAINLN